MAQHQTTLKALEVTGLYKSYGSTKALDGVDFSIEQGEIFALLGPNGAGKTTIVSILTTLENATDGEAHIFGVSVHKNPAAVKPFVGVVPQEIISHGFFDVEEILEFHSGYYGIRDNKKQIAYLLERLSLTEHRHKKVKQLSGGMKRRLMIAKALVHKPKLLLLDEPTAGVDIQLRESLWSFVRELRQDGMTILLTTHYLEEAELLCDKVAVINKGRLCCVSPTREIIQSLSRRQIIFDFKNSEVKLHSPWSFEKQGREIRVSVPAHIKLGEVFQKLKVSTDQIVDLRIEEGGLDEAMKYLLQESRS